MSIAGLILAAGGSRRMQGKNKLLLNFRSNSIIHHVCKTALGTNLNPVNIVTGFEHNLVEKVLPSKIDKIIYNDNWRTGIASSIFSGISSIPENSAGCMIILGDMPLVTRKTINLLISEFEEHLSNKIIYPTYKENQANPVIFPKKYFADISASVGDRGGKKVLKKFLDQRIGVPIDAEEVILDCDTEDDYFLINTKKS